METVETQALRTAFGRVLRTRRSALGLSQEELAHRAGLTPRYISLLECDHRQPTISTVYLLAQGLGMSFAGFCGDIEASYKQHDAPKSEALR